MYVRTVTLYANPAHNLARPPNIFVVDAQREERRGDWYVISASWLSHWHEWVSGAAAGSRGAGAGSGGSAAQGWSKRPPPLLVEQPQEQRPRPGPIDNMRLFRNRTQGAVEELRSMFEPPPSTGGVKARSRRAAAAAAAAAGAPARLQLGRHYRVISAKVWRTLHDIYGGGPTLRTRNPSDLSAIANGCDARTACAAPRRATYGPPCVFRISPPHTRASQYVVSARVRVRTSTVRAPHARALLLAALTHARTPHTLLRICVPFT